MNAKISRAILRFDLVDSNFPYVKIDFRCVGISFLAHAVYILNIPSRAGQRIWAGRAARSHFCPRSTKKVGRNSVPAMRKLSHERGGRSNDCDRLEN